MYGGEINSTPWFMQEKKYPINKWAIDDRPREKLLGKTPSALSDSELLAIIIHHGSGERSAVDLAREILSLSDNNLQELGRLTAEELMRVKGIGRAKAATIAACLELGRRRQASLPILKTAVLSSQEAAYFLQSQFSHYPNEIFAVVFLNYANYVKHYSIISVGGISSTVVDIRLLLKKALDMEAVKLILCHNHPSGNLHPSQADKAITAKIKQAAAMLDLQVLDHVIVSEEGYFSFADEGIL